MQMVLPASSFFIFVRMIGLEILLLLLFVLSILVRYSIVPGADFIMPWAGALLIVFYTIHALGLGRQSIIYRLRTAEAEEKPGIWMKLLSGISFAASIGALIFQEEFWYGRDVFSYSAVLISTVTMFFSMRLFEEDAPEINRNILIRGLAFSTLVAIYTAIPLERRLEVRYDDQYYREILQYAIENPFDRDARRTVINYERRAQGLPPLLDDGEEITE